jgi:methionyl aminopeptidase
MQCFTPGCGKPAGMKCPVCDKMRLDPSFFCGQECFKAFWPIHKLTHISPE